MLTLGYLQAKSIKNHNIVLLFSLNIDPKHTYLYLNISSYKSYSQFF